MDYHGEGGKGGRKQNRLSAFHPVSVVLCTISRLRRNEPKTITVAKFNLTDTFFFAENQPISVQLKLSSVVISLVDKMGLVVFLT